MNKGLFDIRPWILPIALLVVWEVVVRLHIVSASLFPSPISILTTGWDLMVSGELTKHNFASISRAVVGMIIGGLIGFVRGIINGLFDKSFAFVDITIQMIRNVPDLALQPRVIVWFVIDEDVKIFLLVLGVMS